MLQTFSRHILLDTFWEVVAEWLENEEDNPSILVPPIYSPTGRAPVCVREWVRDCKDWFGDQISKYLATVLPESR